MADSAIPLSFRPAQIQEPDLVGQIGRGMSLQQMAQTTQLNAARIQEEKLKAQALDEDRRDQGTIQQAYAKFPGDMKKVREVIAPQVNQRALQAFDKSNQEYAAGVAKMSIDDITVKRETAEQLARHLDAVGAVKPSDTSPEAVAARAAEWAKQVTLAKSKGLDPTNQLTTQYPGDQYLPVLDTQLRGTAKHLADEEARRKTEEAALKTQQTQRQIEVDNRTDAAGVLAAAAQRGAGDYLAARTAAVKKNPSLAGVFPDVPEDAQPVGALGDEFVHNLQNLGMKTHEQATVDATRSQREEQARRDRETAIWHNATADERERHNRRLEDIRSADTKIRQQIADRGVNATFLYREADKHDSLRKQAEDASGQAEQLRQMLTADNDDTITYKGKQVTMNASVRSQIARDAEAAADKARSLDKQALRMRQQYTWGEFGGKTPGEATPESPTSQTLPGGAPTPAPASGAPAPTGTPAPAPKAGAPAPQKMTEADARAKAKAAGKDENWYVNELRKKNLLQ